MLIRPGVKLLRLALGLTTLASCAHREAHEARVDDDPLLACRVAVSPLHTALRTAGGDRAEVLHPDTAADLARLTLNARHDPDGLLSAKRRGGSCALAREGFV